MPPTGAHISQFVIKVDGAAAPQDVMDDLLRVEVDQNLHLPTLFSLTLAFRNMEWLDRTSLREGKKIEISAQEGGSEKRLCSGRIASVEADLGDSALPTVTMRGYDESHVLHRKKRTKPYKQMKDSDIASQVAADSGLSSDVDATSGVYDYVLQANESDYDFLRARSERIGYEFFVEAGKLYFKAPGSFSRGQVALEWGVDLKQFRPRLTTTEQVPEVEVRGWDPKQKREIIGRATQSQGAPQIGETRRGSDIAKTVWGDSKVIVVDRPVNSQAEADALAKAELERISGAFVEAEGVSFGKATLAPGATVEIKGVGQRFGGKYRVTQAQHTYDKQLGYMTSFAVCGRRDNSLLELVEARPEPVGAGVVVGVVTNANDPDDAGRVKVEYSWLGQQVESFWMRVASASAGDNRGLYFLPEVGDEVLIAFEHGDVNHPLVIGSLWNGKALVPEKNSRLVASDGTVERRIIRSRTGHTVILDDSTGSPGITIVDKTGNNKITIDSQSNAMKIEVAGDFTIEARGKINLKSNTNVLIEGQAGTDVKSSGTVNVKGALINLN